MIVRVLLEGLGLGVLLVLVCLFGIRKGPVTLAHLYHADVQTRCVEPGLITREKSGGTTSCSSWSASRGTSRMC